MENPVPMHPLLAPFGAITSLVSAAFSVFTIDAVQPLVTLFGSGIAITSGIYAIRYYHYATKKIKSNDRNKK